jgi:hypothetical protein
MRIVFDDGTLLIEDAPEAVPYAEWDDPAFCPNCGDAFEENTIGDVGWPLRVGVGPRLDILWEVKQKTGIESPDQLLDFPDDAEVLFDVLSYRNGTFDVDTHSF